MKETRKLSYAEISKNRLNPDLIPHADRVPIYGMLDNIRSMYNVGSMFRSSDGALIRKLYCTGYTATPEKADVRKTALGATESIPWEYARDPVSVLQQLKRENVSICVLEQTTNSIPYYDLPEGIFPACLVVGNEITGISEPILPYADYCIEIPMLGTKQSLNVAVAYGIVLFEMLRIFRHSSKRRSAR
jgi:tRNA G18 (ribose-2'-O)-methylase SpoU